MCDSSDPLWGVLTMGGGICCGNVIFLNFFFFSEEQLPNVGMQLWKLWLLQGEKNQESEHFPSLPHGLGTQNHRWVPRPG